MAYGTQKLSTARKNIPHALSEHENSGAVCRKILGVEICLEIVNRYEHFMLNTGAKRRYTWMLSAAEMLKMQFDIFHMNIEEDSFVQAILNAGGRIGYMHLGENNRRPPGRGFLPWKEIFGALKKIGYQGKLTLEPVQHVQRGGEIGNACSIWRDVMPGTDFDEEARRSLALCGKHGIKA